MPGSGETAGLVGGGIAGVLGAFISGALHARREKQQAAQNQLLEAVGNPDFVEANPDLAEQLGGLAGDKKFLKSIGADEPFGMLMQSKLAEAKLPGLQSKGLGMLVQKNPNFATDPSQQANLLHGAGNLGPAAMKSAEEMIKTATPYRSAATRTQGEIQKQEVANAGAQKRTETAQAGATTRQGMKDTTAVTTANIHAKAQVDAANARGTGNKAKIQQADAKVLDSSLKMYPQKWAKDFENYKKLSMSGTASTDDLQAKSQEVMTNVGTGLADTFSWAPDLEDTKTVTAMIGRLKDSIPLPTADGSMAIGYNAAAKTYTDPAQKADFNSKVAQLFKSAISTAAQQKALRDAGRAAAPTPEVFQNEAPDNGGVENPAPESADTVSTSDDDSGNTTGQ